MAKRVRQVQELVGRIASTDGADRRLLERFCRRFQELSPEHRLTVFRWMASDLEVDRSAVDAPIERLQALRADDAMAWGHAMRELREAVASPRRRVLENLINTTGGLKFILELRAEVLEAQRQGEAGLELLDEEIAHLLNVWCQHGLLFLEEVDQRSSFETIRFLKERELVHPMLSLEEMGQRLGQDRMCFALYHAVMPEEPVVFIEVALSRGLVRSIHDIIDVGNGERGPVKSPDTAIFYSINNTQDGLAGLGLGKELIFRVTEALRQRQPSLKTFATLSPIPGFWSHYLRPILEGRDEPFTLERDRVLEPLSSKARQTLLRAHGGDGDDVAAALLAVLSSPDWISDTAISRHLSKPLTEFAYTYLAEETDLRGKPLNPVASFHLGNGATIARQNVNFAANTSPRGLEESCGLMANYVYSRQTLGRTVQALLPWGRRGP
jgi:hypothetical protein